MIKIYGDLISGNCLKIKYVADYLGLKYIWESVDIMRKESRTDAYLALNPAGQVPMLQLDDGRALVQSNAIILYLGEASELLPSDSFERALVNQWLFWEQYSHEPYVAVCRFVMLYEGKQKAEREGWRVGKGESALDLMEMHLAQHDWFVANKLTLADISLLAYTRLAHEGGFDLRDRVNLKKWISRCEEELNLDSAKVSSN